MHFLARSGASCPSSPPISKWTGKAAADQRISSAKAVSPGFNGDWLTSGLGQVEGFRGPDFVIGGAMKAATTTLHRLLAAHDDVFMPGGELNFFSTDDVVEHPDRFFSPTKCLRAGALAEQFAAATERYVSQFQEAGANQTIGEDSTVYLSSELVPARLSSFKPDLKLIFILRDPVSRSYSQYWHMVRTGFAVHGFESTLRHYPEILVRRSLYKRQLARYLQHFPRKQIKVLVFEDFVRNLEERAIEVFDYLGLTTPQSVGIESSVENRGQYPRSLLIQLIWNRMRQSRSDCQLPSIANGAKARSVVGYGRRGIDYSLRSLNLSPGKTPPMRKATQGFLRDYFNLENAGLSALLDLDLGVYWHWFRG